MSGRGRPPFNSTLLYKQPSFALRQVIQFADPDATEATVQGEWFWGATGTAASLDAESGNYAVSGQAAALLRGSVISADAGVYAFSGQVSGLLRGAVLSANSGTFSLAGQNAQLVYASNRIVSAQAGSYLVVGQAASLKSSKVISAESGSYLVNGQVAQFLRGLKLSANAGNYLLSGQTANTFVARLYPDPADVRIDVVYGPGGIYTGTYSPPASGGQIWLRRR